MIFQQTFTITGDEVATDDQVSFIAASISSTSSSNNYQPTIAEGSEKTRIEAKIQESTDSIAALVASGTY
jgi:poly-gamma-glutamate synthesis protein (capsule biosynthesis protein)